MDFSWSDEQQARRKKTATFAAEHLNADLVERDDQSVFLRENWGKCANFGIQGLSVPAEYGGGGTDIMTAMLAMEGFGYGCRDNGLILGLNAQMWTVQQSILHFGTPQQKQCYLPAMCSGTCIGAQAMTEPEAGSDIYSLATLAEKKDGGYLLNGTKTLITLAPVADVVIVSATLDRGLGMWGLTTFLVDRGTPGFEAGPVRNKMGLRTLPLGQLTLQDCFVPAANRLGPEGAGASVSTHSLEWERSCMLASFLGVMERQVESAVDYARRRRQFGQPIGKFQSVSNRIADMKVRLETARLLIYKVAWLKHTGQPAAMESAMAKLYLTECFSQSSLEAIRTHGGGGYLSENEIERDLRDAVGGLLYGGTSDIQRNIITRLLGL
jgi:alkylation response protein AidB-like acyl-CoA dehydrogenase